MDPQKDIDKDNTKEALGSMREFSLSTFGTRIFRYAIRIIKNIVITRLLGPTDRGVFSLLLTITDLIIGFGNLGFGLGSQYLLAKKKYDLKKVLGNTLLVAFLLGSCLAGIGYLVFSYEGILKGDVQTVRAFAPLVLLLIPFVLLQRYGEDIIIAIKQIHFQNLMELCSSSITMALIFPLFLYTGETLKSALFAWAASIIVITFWSIMRILSKSSFRPALSYAYFKESYTYGIRGYLSIVADIMVRKVDVLLISHMLGAQSLGLYAVSVSVAEMLLLFSSSVSQAFLPIRLGLQSKDAKIVTPIVIRHVLFVMLLICLGVAVGGKLIIQLMFGKAFLPAYSSVLWLLPGILALSIYSFLKFDMYSYNLPGFVSWSSVAALLSNLLLNYILIPRYGINGAAISSSIAYGLSTTILLIKFLQLSKISYKEVLFINKAEIFKMLNKLTFKQP
jgi:O-antigen/teichoic acid export membrane protein